MIRSHNPEKEDRNHPKTAQNAATITDPASKRERADWHPLWSTPSLISAQPPVTPCKLQKYWISQSTAHPKRKKGPTSFLLTQITSKNSFKISKASRQNRQTHRHPQKKQSASKASPQMSSNPTLNHPRKKLLTIDRSN